MSPTPLPVIPLVLTEHDARTVKPLAAALGRTVGDSKAPRSLPPAVAFAHLVAWCNAQHALDGKTVPDNIRRATVLPRTLVLDTQTHAKRIADARLAVRVNTLPPCFAEGAHAAGEAVVLLVLADINAAHTARTSGRDVVSAEGRFVVARFANHDTCLAIVRRSGVWISALPEHASDAPQSALRPLLDEARAQRVTPAVLLGASAFSTVFFQIEFARARTTKDKYTVAAANAFGLCVTDGAAATATRWVLWVHLKAERELFNLCHPKNNTLLATLAKPHANVRAVSDGASLFYLSPVIVQRKASAIAQNAATACAPDDGAAESLAARMAAWFDACPIPNANLRGALDATVAGYKDNVWRGIVARAGAHDDPARLFTALPLLHISLAAAWFFAQDISKQHF